MKGVQMNVAPTQRMRATIYGLIDPRSGQVRYVGATVRPTWYRLHSHRTKPLASLKDWMRDLEQAGRVPTLIEFESCHRRYKSIREAYWIRQHLPTVLNIVKKLSFRV